MAFFLQQPSRGYFGLVRRVKGALTYLISGLGMNFGCFATEAVPIFYMDIKYFYELLTGNELKPRRHHRGASMEHAVTM